MDGARGGYGFAFLGGWESMEHRGFALALDALGQGAALCIRLAKPDVATPHGASFTTAPVRIPFIRYK